MVDSNGRQSCPMEKCGSAEFQFFRYFRQRLLTNEGRQSQNTTIMWWSLYYADGMFRPLHWAIFRSNLLCRRLYSVFFTTKVAHYNFNEISLFCCTVLLAKL